MSSDTYDTIYPTVAHSLYNELNINGVMSFLTTSVNGIELKGFRIIDQQAKAHEFIFTYEGTWRYNNERLTIPSHLQLEINKLVCNYFECELYKKERKNMNNIERLEMEVAGIDIPHQEMHIYLKEAGLDGYSDYNASSKANKRAIYEASVSILHSIANQPHLMKNYKQDDMTVTEFSKQLQNRINQLEGKIRQMPVADGDVSNFFNLFQ